MVTPRQLMQEVTQDHTDADFELDGATLGGIGMVAQVLSVRIQTTNTVYTLTDSGVTIEGRHRFAFHFSIFHLK